MPAQLTILSGKGGTGKTTIAASFFYLAESAVTADCDVDAPNLHLLLEPVTVAREPFEGAQLAAIDREKCTECMACEEACAFNAISIFEVDLLSCEGCGVCGLVCPVEAVALRPEVTGEVFVSETEFGPMAHALLVPGGEATGKLVTRTKELASRLAEERGLDLIIVDGSPGIGCPVIASIAGSDLVLAVSEPTRSGLWGLERVHGVAKHFGVPLSVCINKVDINPEIAADIRSYCDTEGVPVLGEIPFDEEVNRATMGAEVLVRRGSGAAADAVTSLWQKTRSRLESIRARS